VWKYQVLSTPYEARAYDCQLSVKVWQAAALSHHRFLVGNTGREYEGMVAEYGSTARLKKKHEFSE